MIACPNCGHPNASDARFCSSCGTQLGKAPAVEARKTVTVVFMDAVGSTGIGERTDPETLRRVMARYFDAISAVVERHGGAIEKYIGDAVMAVFGVPAVHEDDALRAVRAAADIRTRLTGLDQELLNERGLAVQWRTGINTGEVVAGDASAGQRFVTGDAVNVAARLEQAAAPGEILLGGATYRLLRDDVLVEAAAPITAKGKLAPLEAYRLIEIAVDGGRAARHLEAPMVGRQRPLRLLADAFDQAVSDHVCHLFTVLGAAGVGKSRLVREFLAATEDSAMLLRGRCLSYGDGITYWPIAELIRQAAEVTDEDTDQEVLDKIGRLLPAGPERSKAVLRLAEIIGRHEGSAGQEEMFWAVRTLFEALAASRPLVIVLDDLHWAEPTLLDLVENVADWIRDAPLLLICIARRELLETRPSWGGGKPYATMLTLEPLSADESGQLVSGLLGDIALDASAEQRIAQAAEGNPLFVEELIGMLIDSGRLVEREGGGWSVVGDLSQLDVPPTIHALIAARLDGLPNAERIVLERGSVEGKLFHGGAVVELAPDPIRPTVADLLQALSRKELIRPDRSGLAADEAYRFRHLLIRDAAYGALPKETRAELHARFARWLAAAVTDRVAEYEEIIGYHFGQAFHYRTELGLVDEQTAQLGHLAAEHLAVAGERAFDRNDSSAARKLLGAAAGLLPDQDPLATRITVELADMIAKAGDLRRADSMMAAAADAAAAAGDESGKAYAEAVRVDVRSALAEVSIEQLIADCERLLPILERFGDRRGADRARYELARNQFFVGHAKLAENLLVEAIDRASSPATAAQFAAWLPAVLVWGPTPVPEAARRVDELLKGADNRNVEAMAYAGLGMLRGYVGEFDEARSHIRRAVAIREELGLTVMALAHEGNFLGLIEMLARDFGAAESAMRHSLVGLTEAGERGFASTVAGHLANLYVITDRYDEADRYARLGREMASADDIDAQVRALRALARVHAARGDSEAALELAGQAITIADATDYLELRGQTHKDLAEVMLVVGDVAGAIQALEAALRHFEAKGVVVEAEGVHRRLAELGRP